MCKVESDTWHAVTPIGFKKLDLHHSSGSHCCLKSSKRHIRVGVEHMFDVSASPSLHSGGGGYMVIYKNSEKGHLALF